MASIEREVFRYTTAEELKNNHEAIMGMVSEFQTNQLPRLEKLQRYLENDNPGIMDVERRNEEDVADVRTPHAYPSYIVTFMQGYMTGNPITIQYSLDEKIQEIIHTVNVENNADYQNSLLERDASTYGWAFELAYRKEDVVKFKRCDVMNTFVVYDMTMERNRIAGIRFYENRFLEKQFIEFYDDKEKIVFAMGEDGLTVEGQEFHGFGRVPINELENNDERMGDFERVIPQIDLYDYSQSDTANYMQDFNDAILALFGDLDLGPGLDEDKKLEILKSMRKARLMLLTPPKTLDGKQMNVDAKYLTKQYDVAGTEAYKKRIVNDIHKLSFTPDLTDEQFAGTQSAKAMEHKLFGLEVIESNKENALKAFLRERYTLILKVGEVAKENKAFNANALEINIVNKVPSSLADAIENFNLLGGELTNETKLTITKVVDNPSSEQEKLDEEMARTPNLIDRELFDKKPRMNGADEDGTDTGTTSVED